MAPPRYAARKDANQDAVVKRFRASGCTVHVMNGKGIPDLLVGIRGVAFLVEVKDGSKKPSARKLTKAQEEFGRTWKGGTIFIVTKLEEVGTVIDMATKGRRDAP